MELVHGAFVLAVWGWVGHGITTTLLASALEAMRRRKEDIR